MLERESIGGNLPPETEATFDQLSARTNSLVENTNRWANERPEIKTEDEATKAGDFLDQLRTLGIDRTGEIDKARLAEQAPHTDTVAAIREKYGSLKRVVEISMKLMKDKINVWLDKQREIQQAAQRQAEEAARKADAEAAERRRAAEQETGGDVVGRTLAAEDAEKRAAEADRDARRAAAAPKVVSAFGGRAKSQRRRTVVEIEDATKIPAKYLKRLCANAYVTEALERAVRADPNAYEGVPGIIIREERYVA